MKQLKDVSYINISGVDAIAPRKFVSEKYFEAGYFNEKQRHIPFSDDYIDSSTYITAYKGQHIVGTVRIIEYSKKSFPVVKDFQINQRYCNSSTAEIGNLAAEKGSGVAFGLYKKALEYSINTNLKFWLAGIDEKFYLGLMKKYKLFRFFHKKIGEPIHYIGSPTVPIIINLFPLKIYYKFFKRFL